MHYEANNRHDKAGLRATEMKQNPLFMNNLS